MVVESDELIHAVSFKEQWQWNKYIVWICKITKFLVKKSSTNFDYNVHTMQKLIKQNFWASGLFILFWELSVGISLK